VCTDVHLVFSGCFWDIGVKNDATVSPNIHSVSSGSTDSLLSSRVVVDCNLRFTGGGDTLRSALRFVFVLIMDSGDGPQLKRVLVSTRAALVLRLEGPMLSIQGHRSREKRCIEGCIAVPRVNHGSSSSVRKVDKVERLSPSTAARRPHKAAALHRPSIVARSSCACPSNNAAAYQPRLDIVPLSSCASPAQHTPASHISTSQSAFPSLILALSSQHTRHRSSP